MAERVNVGLIGAGRIGRVHAENLAHRVPNVHLAAVADIYLESAERCAKDFDIPMAYQDHRRILDDPDIQAVIICTSTDTHAQMIEEAADAGKQIFCEKPIDFDLAKIDRILKVVEDAGVKLQIGFNRRFDPNFKKAHELIATGKIGEPHILRITSRDPEPPPIAYVKVSGGIFLDMTIHDFDMARFMIGDEVEEIYAVGGVMVDPEIGKAGDIDTAVTILRYRGGTIGTIDNSRKAVYGYDQRVEVFGSEGVIIVSNPPSDAVVLTDAHGEHGSLPLFFFVERYMDAYATEMIEFINCILEDKTPPVTGVDGRIPVVMGYAAKRSLEEHRPVKLNEIDPSLG